MRAPVPLTVLALVAFSSANAANLHVPSDYPTVGAALGAAVAGDTVSIAPGGYPESGLIVPGGILLQGEGAVPDDTWLDGGQSGAPILTIPLRAAPVTIRRLSLRNGSGANAGGLVANRGTGRHTVIECSFTNNQRAVHAQDIELRDCTFDSNAVTAGDGGAVAGGVVRVTGGVFRNNRSGNQGGALTHSSGEIRFARFEGNVTATRGGAIYSGYGVIRDCVFVDNSTTGGGGRGGAIYTRSPHPLERCHFQDNHAANGGAVAAGNPAIVRASRFLANSATYGGALFAEYANLTVEDCALVRNHATTGGGIYAPATSGRSLTMRRVVIQGSTAGGAVAAHSSGLPPAVEACDIFGNVGGDWVGPLAGRGYTNGSFSADARFCADPADSLFVSGASPLLAANNGLGVNLGAARIGCDVSPLVVSSIPPGLTLEVDGTPVGLPAAFPWTPGTPHTLSAPDAVEPVPGVGWAFQDWSDGGAATHTVIAPAAPANFAARYSLLGYRLDVTADSGATVEPPSGWMTPGVPVTVRATPVPGYAFLGWVGTGPGSYTGPNLEFVVPMTGPVTEHARLQYVGTCSLTTVAVGGGSVLPPSGLQTGGSVVTIRAFPEPGWRFDRWTGTGVGSYSGTAATAQITMLGDIREEAAFSIINPRTLTMVAGLGGQVSPASGIHPLGAVVTIRAIPDPGWTLDRWVGIGAGSYTGTQHTTSIRINGNVQQTATFRWLGPVAPVQIVAVGDGAVSPASGDFTVGLPIHITATPAPGATFYRWIGEGPGSYTGTSPEANILVLGPMTQTAYFAPAGGYPLVTSATVGGTVYPPSGSHAAGEEVGLTATPAVGYRFVEWQGTGLGSYSGPDAAATVTMHGPITEHAVFEPDGLPHGYELSVSGSDTDPFVNASPPTGAVRPLHLWLTCSLDGIAALECGVETALPVFGFTPAPGVLNAGTERDLLLAIGDCPTGAPVAVRLGTWWVMDTGGEVCLGPSTARGVFAGVDCSSVPTVSGLVRARGFASSGAAPCVRGTSGCPAGPAPEPAAIALAPARSGLGAVLPNPFRDVTEIRFALAAPGRARVAVYDVAGRLLRVLRDGELPAGVHATTWDGRAGGERAAGGVYFVRLETGGREETKRVVYLGAGR